MSAAHQVERHWQLIRRLAASSVGVTIQELAESLGASDKTIRRDLVKLRRVGLPLEETTGEFNRKSWRITPHWASEVLSKLCYDEALALCLGRRMLEPLAGTFFWSAMQTALTKIRAAVGVHASGYAERMSSYFHRTAPGASDYSRQAEVIDELLMGIEESKSVRLTYQSARATEPVTYDIHPYGVTFHRDSLYVVGYSPNHGELRHWKVDRVTQAEKRSDPFHRPQDFDIAQHFADSFGIFQGHEKIEIRVRFAPTVARYVTESKWHASQKLTPQRDGSLIAEFTLSSTTEIRSWLLSFGATAEVLAPDTLRAEVCEEISRLQNVYETGEFPMQQDAPIVAKPAEPTEPRQSAARRRGTKAK